MRDSPCLGLLFLPFLGQSLKVIILMKVSVGGSRVGWNSTLEEGSAEGDPGT